MSDNTPLYLCDPAKNAKCQKTACQKSCKLTTNKEFAKLDADGKPIIGDTPGAWKKRVKAKVLENAQARKEYLPGHDGNDGTSGR